MMAPEVKKNPEAANPDQTLDGQHYQFLERNYATIRITRTFGILKKSWTARSETGGYTWACVIPFSSFHKNAVIFHFECPARSPEQPAKSFDLKVILNIAPGRFKGRRGSMIGDLFFRLDVTEPYELCNLGAKDCYPNWKHFVVSGSFDISDAQKVRRGIAVEPRDQSVKPERSIEAPVIHHQVFGLIPVLQPPTINFPPIQQTSVAHQIPPTAAINPPVPFAPATAPPASAIAPVTQISTNPTSNLSYLARPQHVETEQQLEARLKEANFNRMVEEEIAILRKKLEERKKERERVIMEKIREEAREKAKKQMREENPGEDF